MSLQLAEWIGTRLLILEAMGGQVRRFTRKCRGSDLGGHEAQGDIHSRICVEGKRIYPLRGTDRIEAQSRGCSLLEWIRWIVSTGKLRGNA